MVVAIEMVRSFRRQRVLRKLARQWDMHFAAGDRLRLASRVAPHLPIPGAANVRVRDLLFRTHGDLHHYLFSVDYTVGVIRGKIGRCRVAGFQEPVSRGVRLHRGSPVLALAPYGLSLTASYEYVRDALAQASGGA